ncbi:hypothetical protein EX895_004261 [Sporisorium graminicola]|uniref:Rab-GAP TBC domain-containing protein n=1 Tax=Sporisorium graminicola TaxID=280036 RepID=A0A4U7KUH3_9BASI|nr:hypothetical protein EX895_004261 [Sporisorium graminicola]TKY86622.1 hypothetical protein EX895_004261 [Sporisorium graminicola]
MTSPARAPSVAQAHPLFAGESPTKSPGPSSLVNRPIWGQRKAAKVDYSVESQKTLQRRSVSRTSSYHHDGASSSSSSSTTTGGGSLRPATIEDDVFYSRTANAASSNGADAIDAKQSTSYIPRTSRVSSYDLQFDDADEPSLPDDSLFGGPTPSSPRIFDRDYPAPKPIRSSQLRASTATETAASAASPDQTPMPKHHLDRPSSRASRRDGTASPSEGRRPRSSTPNGSRSATSANHQSHRVHDMAREVEFPLDWLQQLHRLGDGDLESALSGPLSHRPVAAQQPRESTPVKTSKSSARRDTKQAPSYALQLTKALSRALAEAHAELDKLRSAAEQERAQHAETMEHVQQRNESREAAFTELCLENGIKQGQINRSLLRAPVLDAEVLKRKRIAKQQQSMAQEMAGIEPPPDRTERALPDSLQEAMLDDLEGVANTSIVARSPSLKPSSVYSAAEASSPGRSPSVRSHKTTASVDATRSSRQRGKSLSISIASTNDKEAESRSLKSSSASVADSISTSPSSLHRAAVKSSPQPPASPKLLHTSKSPSVASPRARSTSSSTSTGGGLGDWASGLLPWSGGGASRKGAPSTAQSMVKVTSPGRREMAASAGTAAGGADAAGKRSVSASKTSKVASASTFARAFGRYTRSSPAPETPPPAGPQPNVTRLPDTYQFDRRSADPALSLSAGEGIAILGAPSPRPPSAAVELEPILPNEAAPPTLVRRKKKGRKSGMGAVAGLGIASSSSKELEDQAKRNDTIASSKESGGGGGSSSSSNSNNSITATLTANDTPLSSKQKHAARLSTLDEEESSGDEFEVYGGKAPVPGFTNMTEHASSNTAAPTTGATQAASIIADSSIVVRAADDSDTDSESEEDIQVLTDRYGFIYNPTDADIRLLRQARKASAPAPATLTGIKVGIRARGGSDSASEDDKNDPDLDTADSSEDELDLSRAVKKPNSSLIAPQVDHNDVQLVSASRSASPAPSTEAASAAEGAISDDGAATADSASTNAKRAKRRSKLLTVPDSKPVQAEVLPVSAVSKPSPSPSRSSPSKNRRGTQSNASSRSSSPVKAGGTVHVELPSISNTVRRLLTQLKDMHDSQQIEQKQRWDAFLEHRRARLQAASDATGVASAGTGNHGVSSTNGTSASMTSSTSKTKALLAGALFGGGAPAADGAKALGSAEKAPEEDWSSGMVGVNRMGDSKSGKEDWREFLTLCQTGIPLCYRARIWAECSGANDIAEPGRYQELLSDHQGETNECLTQIDLDVHRTMPTNVYFGGDGQGVPKLRRLLVAFSWYNPDTGYCQGMNNLAATLLLTHATEEEAFWVLVCLIEKILPSEYYTSHLLVSQADQRVLIELVAEHMPRLHAHILDLGVDLPAITFAWFLSLYTDCLPVETLFRVWDVMFVEGMVILFRVAMAILKLYEKELLATGSASAFYGLAHSLTSRLFSVDKLIHLACNELKASIRYASILEKRERHVADLTAELGLGLDVTQT